MRDYRKYQPIPVDTLPAQFAGIFHLDMQDIGAQQTGMSKDEFKARLVAAGR